MWEYGFMVVVINDTIINGYLLTGIHSHLSHRPKQSPDHNHLNTDHPNLQPSISTLSNTRFTQTLIVRSTVHYPEQFPDPVCTYLCILTFQNPDDLPVMLQRSTPLFLVPALLRSCNSHQYTAKTLWTDTISKTLTCHLLLTICFHSVNKSSCYSTYLRFLTQFMTLILLFFYYFIFIIVVVKKANKTMVRSMVFAWFKILVILRY